MNCKDLEFNISVYSDDILTQEELSAVDAHLVKCPLCRQKLAEFQAIRNDLRILARPEMPFGLLNTVRNSVAREIAPSYFAPLFKDNFYERLRANLIPYGFGTALSLIFCLTLLLSLVSVGNIVNQPIDFAANEKTEQNILLAKATPDNISDKFYITPNEFASSRLAVSQESPSVNPNGALIALTKSLMRGEMKDEEIVIVADVFGNGLAKIDEVIEPSSNRRAVIELQKALQSDPDYAPFVPAKMDNRSDRVRVILKFQTVNVK